MTFFPHDYVLRKHAELVFEEAERWGTFHTTTFYGNLQRSKNSAEAKELSTRLRSTETKATLFLF
ncbi:hypothetical protein PYCH_14040 [Pyrococcus yayanosii CH1]|uniref:Uncharacterized protein n=1 Tax=Pyrococcus yayanosii (strain CH1 / JCM 16557) TaxID=529709 RepID=F8AG20_PYRYC|nr:hypothetical protein PYCH_14040 [Pyrococcus yayanosii CH1]